MRTFEEIHEKVEDLYRSGVESMQLTGTDTQYAPAREVLESLLQKAIVKDDGDPMKKAVDYDAVWDTFDRKADTPDEKELRLLLEFVRDKANTAKLSRDAARIRLSEKALRWVLEEIDYEDIFKA